MNQMRLTQVDDGGFSQKLRGTKPGQASLAGEGPKGATCRSCQHWAGKEYYAKSNKQHGPTLKPARCGKHKQFSGRYGPNVPHSASACKYFEPCPNALPISNPKEFG